MLPPAAWRHVLAIYDVSKRLVAGGGPSLRAPSLFFNPRGCVWHGAKSDNTTAVVNVEADCFFRFAVAFALMDAALSPLARARDGGAGDA